MDFFVHLLINGLAVGGLYALLSLGYTMVYGVLGIVNFAHGDILMIGVMITLTAYHMLMSLFPHVSTALLLCVACCLSCFLTGFLGVLIERLFYRRFRFMNRLIPIVAAFSLSLFLQMIAMLIWGREYLPFPSLFHERVSHLTAHISIAWIQLFVIFLVFLSGCLLLWFFRYTRWGRAVRALAESIHIAELMGVRVNTLIALIFFIGAFFAALSGILFGAVYNVAHYQMGFSLGLKAFTAAVLGGIGSITGAFLGGFLLGVLESLASGYLPTLTHGFITAGYQNAIAFFILMCLLLIRPTGLLGVKVSDRV